MPAGITVEEPELPFPVACELDRSPLGRFAECPMCGGALTPEHAHDRCRTCGWRDSCCD